jgi:hypothetical protein
LRPKVVIAILSIALGVLGILAWISRDSRPQPDAVPAEHSPADANPALVVPAAKPANAGWIAPSVAANAGTATAAGSENEYDKLVDTRCAELKAMAMQNDPQAHQQIVDELQNADKNIRQAALEALKQADDRSVVPRMQQMADQTNDPARKQEILDAIEFINLPSLSEYLHQHQKQ